MLDALHIQESHRSRRDAEGCGELGLSESDPSQKCSCPSVNSEPPQSPLHRHIFHVMYSKSCLVSLTHHHRQKSLQMPHCHVKLVTNFEIIQSKQKSKQQIRHFPPWILFEVLDEASIFYRGTSKRTHTHT